MTLVNENFLQHEGSTDVITFDHSNAEGGVRKAEFQIHGELFVCVDEAWFCRAKEFGTSWQSPKWCATSFMAFFASARRMMTCAQRHRSKMKREENRLVRTRFSQRFSLTRKSAAPLKSAREEIVFFARSRASFLTGLAITLPAIISIRRRSKRLFGTVSSFTDALLFFLKSSPGPEGGL